MRRGGRLSAHALLRPDALQVLSFVILQLHSRYRCNEETTLCFTEGPELTGSLRKQESWKLEGQGRGRSIPLPSISSHMLGHRPLTLPSGLLAVGSDLCSYNAGHSGQLRSVLEYL